MTLINLDQFSIISTSPKYLQAPRITFVTLFFFPVNFEAINFSAKKIETYGG